MIGSSPRERRRTGAAAGALMALLFLSMPPLAAQDGIVTTPCDSIGTFFEEDPEQNCCVNVRLRNSMSEYWVAIRLRIISGGNVFGAFETRDGWTADVSTPATEALVYRVDGVIPVCTDSSHFSLCFDGPQPVEALVEIEWIGKDEVYCRDTIPWTCEQVFDPCDDPLCRTDTLDIRTGMNASPGGFDPHWVLIAVPDSSSDSTVPRAPCVIDNNVGWYPFDSSSAAEWISANPQAAWTANNPDQPYVFRYCFCVCRSDTVLLDMRFWVDNKAIAWLDGKKLSETNEHSTANFREGTGVTHRFPVSGGSNHCLTFEVYNITGVAMGLMVEGSITGSNPLNPSFIRHECCQPPDTVLSVRDARTPADPPGFRILGYYPDPMRHHGTVELLLERAMPVRVDVYSLSGRLLATLADAAFEAGTHAVGISTAGYPSGVYLLRLSSGNRATVRTFRVVK